MQSVKDKFKNATAKTGSGESKYVKLNVGRNEVRIIAREYDENPWVLFSQHYVNGEYLLCKGQGCPLCSEGWSKYRENNKVMTPEIKKNLPNQRVMLNVMVNGEHKILTISQTQLQEILELDGSDDLFGWEDGKSLIIKRTGEGLLTKYSYQIGSVLPVDETEIVSAIDLDKIIGEMKST